MRFGNTNGIFASMMSPSVASIPRPKIARNTKFDTSDLVPIKTARKLETSKKPTWDTSFAGNVNTNAQAGVGGASRSLEEMLPHVESQYGPFGTPFTDPTTGNLIDADEADDMRSLELVKGTMMEGAVAASIRNKRDVKNHLKGYRTALEDLDNKESAIWSQPTPIAETTEQVVNKDEQKHALLASVAAALLGGRNIRPEVAVQALNAYLAGKTDSRDFKNKQEEARVARTIADRNNEINGIRAKRTATAGLTKNAESELQDATAAITTAAGKASSEKRLAAGLKLKALAQDNKFITELMKHSPEYAIQQIMQSSGMPKEEAANLYYSSYRKAMAQASLYEAKVDWMPMDFKLREMLILDRKRYQDQRITVLREAIAATNSRFKEGEKGRNERANASIKARLGTASRALSSTLDQEASRLEGLRVQRAALGKPEDASVTDQADVKKNIAKVDGEIKEAEVRIQRLKASIEALKSEDTETASEALNGIVTAGGMFDEDDPITSEFTRSLAQTPFDGTGVMGDGLPTPAKIKSAMAANGYEEGQVCTDKTDCSMFASKLLISLGFPGVKPSWTTQNLKSYGTPITSAADLQPGDLVLFGSRARDIGHVGVYMGNGQMVHASKVDGKGTSRNNNYRYQIKTVGLAQYAKSNPVKGIRRPSTGGV